MAVAQALNDRELARYERRVADRRPLTEAIVGGAGVDDARRVVPQRERGPEFVVRWTAERGVPILDV